MQGEEGNLQGGVHPEEFVAIADYSATDETQVAMWVMLCGFSMFRGRIRCKICRSHGRFK